MDIFYLVFGVIIGSTLTAVTHQQTEHYDIPILEPNHTTINNTYTIISSLNLTDLWTDEYDQESPEAYDDGFALMDHYVEDENVTLTNENQLQKIDTGLELASNVSTPLDGDDDDSDFSFMVNRGRWSYAPGFVERMCRAECQDTGKPFGRLLGTRCQCYCPLNAPSLGLCDVRGKCDRYCAYIGYSRGGDCVYNNVCFCFCRKKEPYDPATVYPV